MQLDPAYRDVMTYSSPSTGEPVSTSFLVPYTREELVRKRKHFKLRADHNFGFMGRAPDFMNQFVTGWHLMADRFARGGARFGENATRYYELIRERDLFLTHMLINPQIDRSKTSAQQEDPFLHLGRVRETPDGIVVRGAKMLGTMAPITEEVAVIPFGGVPPGDDAYALVFGIPTNTPRPHVHLPGDGGPAAALALRPSAVEPLRGDGLHRRVRRRAGPVGPGPRRRPPGQRRDHQHPGRRLQRPPQRPDRRAHAEPARVLLRARHEAGGRHRHHRLPAHPGEAGRDAEPHGGGARRVLRRRGHGPADAERRVGARRARPARLSPADREDLHALRGDRADAGRRRVLLRADRGRPGQPRGAPLHRPLRARARGGVRRGAHRPLQAGLGRHGRDVRPAHGPVRALLLRRSHPADRGVLRAVRQGAALRAGRAGPGPPRAASPSRSRQTIRARPSRTSQAPEAWREPTRPRHCRTERDEKRTRRRPAGEDRPGVGDCSSELVEGQ